MWQSTLSGYDEFKNYVILVEHWHCSLQNANPIVLGLPDLLTLKAHEDISQLGISANKTMLTPRDQMS